MGESCNNSQSHCWPLETAISSPHAAVVPSHLHTQQARERSPGQPGCAVHCREAEVREMGGGGIILQTHFSLQGTAEGRANPAPKHLGSACGQLQESRSFMRSPWEETSSKGRCHYLKYLYSPSSSFFF